LTKKIQKEVLFERYNLLRFSLSPYLEHAQQPYAYNTGGEKQRLYEKGQKQDFRMTKAG